MTDLSHLTHAGQPVDSCMLDRWFEDDLPLLRGGPWRKRKNRNGIVVFDRPHATLRYHHFKVQTVMKAPVEAIRRMYVDDVIARYPDWNGLYLDGRLVEDLGTDPHPMAVVWLLLDKPVPVVGRRETVYLRATRALPDGGIQVLYRSVLHPEQPPRRDAIRVVLSDAGHLLRPTPAGTEVTYMMHNQPEGHLPALLVNRLTADVLHTQLVEARRCV